MSLDDETPTQYFGADRRLWRHPGTGAIHSLSPADYDRATLTDTGHRKGCAFGRTARCTCTYLAQWDKAPAYTAPAFVGGIVRHPMLDQGHTFVLSGTAEPDISAHFPSAHYTLEEDGTVTRNVKPEEVAWGSAEQDPDFWNIDAPGTVSGLLPADTVPREVWKQDLSDTELKVTYWHKEYKQVRKNFYTMFGLALAGWLLALARGIWGF